MCSNCGNNSNKEANNLVLIQDVISIKSYLQKLRRILHDVSIFFSDFLKGVSDLEMCMNYFLVLGTGCEHSQF